MSISLCATGSRFVALLAFTVAAVSCGGKVVSPEDNGENGAGEQDAASSVASGPSPSASAPNTGTPPPTPSGVAANCASANVVYADVLDASGTSVTAGARLFPVQFAYSSSLGTATDLVELSTFNGEGPNGVALTVGGTAAKAEPLAIEPYVEPPDDSAGGTPFLALVVDGEDLTQDGTASGGFAITALAGNSSDGVLEPFSIAFDLTITSPKGVAHVIGCGNWTR